jgi:hypothetical protein
VIRAASQKLSISIVMALVAAAAGKIINAISIRC